MIDRATSFATLRHLPARGLVGALVAAAALAGYGAAEPAPAAAASQPDLSYISSSTWTADPATARVHVAVAITATSHARDANGHQSYYDTLEITLPPAATDIAAATAGGNSRPVTVQGRNSSGIAIVISIGQRLYLNDSAAIVLHFDLVDQGGSTDRDLRIGHNLMSFPVSAFGSPNTPGSSVSVIFPSDFTVQEEFGSLTRSIFGADEIVFLSGPLQDSASLSAWFTATQPVPESNFRTRTIDIGQLSVSLRYWMDDPGWADAVAAVLTRGIPVLREMIGLGDPANHDLVVVEASTQEIGGFAGAFDQIQGQVQISYLADPFVILHEAAHLWFNGSLASDRWIQEGFASYYAEQAVMNLDLVDHSPQLSDRLREAAVPFNDWITAGVPSSPTDSYLYAATLVVAGRIADEVGQSGLQRIWREAWAGTAAYQPGSGPPREGQAGVMDWRRFLDLLELTAGLSFENIWNVWVVTPTQVPLLTQRLITQNFYRQVVSLAGDWALPIDIRQDMDGWQFDQAQSELAAARVVLTARQQIGTYAAREDTTPPSTLRTTFENSGVQAASAEARAELQVLDALAAAAQARASSKDDNAFLMGSDPNADLQAARAAFAQGNLQSALSLATSAQKAWQGGYTAQVVRLLGIVAGSIGLLMLLAVGLWGVARRPRGLDRATSAVPAELPAATYAPDTDGERAPHPHLGERVSGVAADLAGNWLDRIPILAMARGGAEGGRSRGDGDGSPSADGGGKSPDGPEGLDTADLEDEARATDAESASDGTNPFGAGFGEPGNRDESAYDLLRRGQALLHDRHNAQAAVVLERAARVEPGKGSILEALGRAYFNSGQHVRAAETFEALLEVDPSAHYGHFGLGLSFARLGREQEARTHLRMAAALDPASDTYRRALDKFESKKS